MADPVTDFDREIWFDSYIKGREDAIFQEKEKVGKDGKIKYRPCLLFPRPDADHWTWQQKAAWRDGYMTGFKREAIDANITFLWDWGKVKWE